MIRGLAPIPPFPWSEMIFDLYDHPQCKKVPDTFARATPRNSTISDSDSRPHATDSVRVRLMATTALGCADRGHALDLPEGRRPQFTGPASFPRKPMDRRRLAAPSGGRHQ